MNKMVENCDLFSEASRKETKIDEFNLGDKAFVKKVATAEVFNAIAEFSGDYNPIHFDDAYAEKSIFGSRIAHGLFCLGMVSYLVGMVLPGNGAIFLNEAVKYSAPVYIGDEITTTVEVINIDKNKKKMNIGFICINQNNIVVMEGTTQIKLC